MLLRPRRPPPLAPPAPPSPASPDPELQPAGEAPRTPPGRPASPDALEEPASPVSPGSAQRTPWSAWETELLLDTLLQPAVWRSLLLDRRQSLPTYRRVSAALARQQVRRTPAQCRRRYKFLKDKLREAQGQPPGPFDAQIRELMGLLGDTGRKRPRRPGRPQRGRRPASRAPAATLGESGAPPLPAARDPNADPAWTLRFSPSPSKSTDASRAPCSPPAPTPTALPNFIPGPGSPQDHVPVRAPASPPPPAPHATQEDADSPPGRPEERAPPQAAPSLNAALLQTLGHLGDIVAVLGPLRDQLLTLNQHVEQLRGSFDQTVSLAVGFILGSAAAERGVLRDPRE
ncbi:undifferentiated embryonic cell transcription factor 1 [Lemur catta]|uniref:undifferentiated embryonic cell transcription factor 1 n=1 Tax=Lemur catta TaxID=9447 RepID=UPI001E26BE60|nr:undifferentiated embryonic cell transcription factor 1 [Lemur catta]